MEHEAQGRSVDRVEPAQRLTLLDTGRLDLAFAYDAFIPGHTPREKIFEPRAHVLLPANHRLADAPAVHLEDLVDEDRDRTDFIRGCAH